MKIKCDFCNKKTDRKPSQVKYHRFHFCDKKCRISYSKIHPEYTGRPKSKTTRRKIALSRLGRKFPKLSSAKKGKPAWNRGLTVFTDNRIAKYASKQKGQKRNGKYSRGKEHYNWKGGMPKRNIGWEWNKRAKEILVRDSYTCQCCGVKSNNLEVHHLIPFRYAQDDSFDNLVSLCRKCHRLWERHFYTAFPTVVRSLEDGTYS